MVQSLRQKVKKLRAEIKELKLAGKGKDELIGKQAAAIARVKELLPNLPGIPGDITSRLADLLELEPPTA